MKNEKRNLLFVAYHFPPIAVSSGYQRTLAFSKYLSQFGWRVTVLSASNKAYENWKDGNLTLIPPDVHLIKAFARDTQRHFSLKGRYARFMALPDKWQSWIFGGCIAGLINCLKHRPKAIITTYPIASG